MPTYDIAAMEERAWSRRFHERHREDEPIEYGMLLTLADFLEGLPDKLFDFSTWVQVPYEALEPAKAFAKGGGCGTVACAVGWLPLALPKHFRYEKERRFDVMVKGAPARSHLTMDAAAQAVLNLSEAQSDYLFVPCECNDDDEEDTPHAIPPITGRPVGGGTCTYSGLPSTANAKQVAQHIRDAVAHWQAQEAA